jgi:hypothetical protein
LPAVAKKARKTSSSRNRAMRRSGMAAGYRSSAERPGYQAKESSLLMPLMGGLGLLVLLGLGYMILSLGAADEAADPGQGTKAYSGVAPVLSYVLPKPGAVLPMDVRIKGVVSPEDAPLVMTMQPADPKTRAPEAQRTRALGGSFKGRFKLSHGKWTLLLVGGGGDEKVVLAERVFRVDGKPPELELEAPPAQVMHPELTLKGTCRDDSQVKLTVNGEPVPLGADGRFSHTVELTTGRQEVRVRAVDAFEQADTRRFTVEYR